MAVYYNEFEPYCVEWLRELIRAGVLPEGDVDDRDIRDLTPADLKGYAQCHFFSGMGGWSYALRLAGWEDDRQVWTGSCPCQPFSLAGKGKAQSDDRHLWPVWFNLIRECRPPVVFGEQVSAAIGHGWLDGVYADLEGQGYACGSAVLPACSVDAPHKRDRLWFVSSHVGKPDINGQQARGVATPALGYGSAADAASGGRSVVKTQSLGRGEGRAEPELWSRCPAPAGASLRDANGDVGNSASRVRQECSGKCKTPLECPVGRPSGGHSDVADSHSQGPQVGQGQPGDARAECPSFIGDGRSGGVADANQFGSSAEWEQRSGKQRGSSSDQKLRNGAWDDAEWFLGADGKARRVKSGVCLLANGVPARISKLRALGNAIVPQVAAAFIQSFMETQNESLH